MKNEIENVLNYDPLAHAEKMLGDKHWSEFTDDENMFALGMSMLSNEHKDEILKAGKDTHFRMTWNEFKNILTDHGFINGLTYEIDYDKR